LHVERKRTLFDAREQRTWSLDTRLKALGLDQALAPKIMAFADEHIALVDKRPDPACSCASGRTTTASRCTG
jgi:hypothetical protein